MKLWMPLGILCLLALVASWNSALIYNQTQTLQTQIEAVDEFAEVEDWDNAQAALEASHDQWDGVTSYLSVMSNHTTVDAIEGMYLRAMAFCQTHEPTEFRAELADLHHALQVLQNWESPSLGNLF